MTFKLDPDKQSQEVEKHFNFYLNDNLELHEHLQNMFKKVNKTISLLSKLRNNLPKPPLGTIHKLFTGPH